MKRKETNYLKSILLSGLGFGFGGVIGNIGLYFLVRSQLLRWPLELVPEDQRLVLLITAIVLIILGAVVTTGIGGAVAGYVVSVIDPIFPRRKYLWRTAIATGLTEGLLIIPLLLFTAVLALYNNGLDREPTGFIIVFAIFGAIFGLVFGLIQGLSTVGWRQLWRVLLASILGFGLGGGAIGYGLRAAYYPATRGEPLPNFFLLLPLLSFVFFGIGGLLLGWVYEWVTQWRVENAPDEPARWVKIAGVLAAIILAFFLVSNYRQLVEFVTIRPGSVSSQLLIDSVGVHWKNNEIISNNLSTGTDGQFDITSSNSGLSAAVWIEDQGGNSEVYSSLQSTENQDWLEPVLVSSNQESTSTHPKIAIDPNDTRHVVWAGSGELSSDIFYISCSVDECGETVRLTSQIGNVCGGAGQGELNPYHDWPVISIAGGSTIMVMWSNQDNQMFYSIWGIGQSAPVAPTGCLEAPGRNAGVSGQIQPQISGKPDGSFSVVYEVPETGSETVYQLDFIGQQWSVPQSLGEGTSPSLFTNPRGETYYAWCDQQSKVRIKDAQTSLVDVIEFPTCAGRPEMALSEDGALHLVWYSEEIRNNLNLVSSANILYESIQTNLGWSEPAIVVETEGITSPQITGKGTERLDILWSDGGGTRLHSAYQPDYTCSEEELGGIGRVMLGVIESGAYRPENNEVPFCKNKFEQLIYMPNPEQAYSIQPQNENGGFEEVSKLANLVKYELDLSIMEWAPDEDSLGINPGNVFTKEIAKLYDQIKENPDRYPRGLTVRILLGNYPELADLHWGEQIWNVIEDLRNAGVDKMVDSNIGWNVEVANYEGVYPHSHTKFMIVDGRLVIGAGFNYGYLHFPYDHISNKGGDLFDLGLVMTGPIAQQVLTTFDDYWQGAEKLYCPDLSPDPGFLWNRDCVFSEAQVTHVPEVKKYFIPDSPGEFSNAFSLNRNYKFKESDDVITAALSSANETLDILEVNFSLELTCMLDMLNDEVCSYDNALDYMKAIMNAVEENQVKVRVLVEKINSNGMENRISIKEFSRELEKRGLSEFVEFKFFEGRMHAKAFLVDDEVLFVGSQNFHYSAWGEGGLAEYNLATDDPRAVSTFQTMFDYYWESGIPWQEYSSR